MSKKLIYIMVIFFIGSIIFLFLQNKVLTNKTYEILSIGNYKSLAYLKSLENKEYSQLRIFLIEDLKQLINHYNKNIYFKNAILKNICKDIDVIKNFIGKDIYLYQNQINIIKKDCIR